MKNYIAHTFILTLVVIVILLGLHFLPTITVNGYTLRKVNMLSDVEVKQTDEEGDADTDAAGDSAAALPPAPVAKPAFVDSCKAGMTCIEDYSDSTGRGMAPFYRALDRIRTENRLVRIAYLGDSFIEADILTGDLRDMLQEHFGGSGVGFVDITSMVRGFRITVQHDFGGWSSYGLNDKGAYDHARVGLSGHYFIPHAGAYVETARPAAHRAHLDSCQQASIYFISRGETELTASVNGTQGEPQMTGGNGQLQKLTVQGNIKKIRWTVNRADSSTFYGVAMDGLKGIALDNFGVRSSSGLHLRSIPLERLKQFNRERPYDLIILQYGLNVAGKNTKNYDYYTKPFKLVLEHIKEAFPQAGILVVGVGDREARDEEGNMRTMPGVKNLMRVQQAMAAEAGVAFWNLYEAMGGEGSIVEMVNAKPAQANLDYTHINFRGGKVLARKLYETLLYGKEQYDKRKAYEKR